ncbi:MAG: hypothetical protein V7K48_13435 [Nostoc sp.]
MLAYFHVRASIFVGVASASGEGEVVRQSYNSTRGCALSVGAA